MSGEDWPDVSTDPLWTFARPAPEPEPELPVGPTVDEILVAFITTRHGETSVARGRADDWNGPFRGLGTTAEDATGEIVAELRRVRIRGEVRHESIHSVMKRSTGPHGRPYVAVPLVRRALDRLVKTGQIAAHGEGKHRRYLTADALAAAHREANLTDGERAERAAAIIVNRYEEERVRRPEMPSIWPTGAYGEDGVREAVEARLIISVGRDSWGKARYVPVDRHEQWVEACATVADAEARAKLRHEQLVARLAVFHPSESRGRATQLHTNQVEALVGTLEGLVDKLNAARRALGLPALGGDSLAAMTFTQWEDQLRVGLDRVRQS